MSPGVSVNIPRSVLEEVAFRLMYRHRVADFLGRHGGNHPARQPLIADSPCGSHGWREVYAADGYTLRCEWRRAGAKEAVQFTEIAPRTAPRLDSPSSASVVDPHCR
jgi:hypothetical protein